MVERKEAKKENLRKKENKSMLEAQSTEIDGRMTSSVPASKPPLPTSQEPIGIYRFGTFRSDPFLKYPFELSHRELKLLDHSK